MKKIALATGFLGFSLFFSSLAFGASISSMTKDDATKAFSDKTFSTIGAVTLDNNIIENTFTGYFSKDGKIKGKFKNKPNGSPQNDTGTWKVNDKAEVCFKWDHWDSNKERCVTPYRLQNGILIVNTQNAIPGSLAIMPAKQMVDDLKRDYLAMTRMIFGEVPEFSAVLKVISELEYRINHGSKST